MQKVFLVQSPRQVIVEPALGVALEHLHGDDHVSAPARQPLQNGPLDAMSSRVVVLFTYESHVGPGDLGQHGLEVAESFVARFVDAMRNISRIHMRRLLSARDYYGTR